MRLLRPMGLAWVALIREGTSQVPPPRTLVAAKFGTEPWRPDHELRRRQDRESLEDLLSGTLTLTIAPDETCGYYGDGPTHYVCGGSACTWESGTINRLFCGWANLETACYDETDTCDNDCLTNGYSLQCTDSINTVCELISLGKGIYGHNCVDTKVGLPLDTARGREPGDFTTMVVVNRSQVSLIVGDDEDSESTTEITQQAFPSSTSESTSSTSESTSSTSTTAESTETDEAQSTSSTTSQPSSSKGGGSSGGGVEVGPIVGGVVGGLAVIGLTVGFLGYMCLRRRNHPVNPAYSSPAYHDHQQPYTPETKGTPFDRLRQLVGRSTPPVELPGGTTSPTMAYTHRGQE